MLCKLFSLNAAIPLALARAAAMVVIYGIFPDGSFADIRIIILAALAGRCINYQVDFAVHNAVHDIGATFMQFFNFFGDDSIFLQEAVGSCRGLMVKPSLLNSLAVSRAAALS